MAHLSRKVISIFSLLLPLASLGLVIYFNSYTIFNKNDYSMVHVTMALQEGFFTRRFFVGTLLHPFFAWYGYDYDLMHTLSRIGFFLLIITTFIYLFYSKVGNRFLFALVLLFMPGSLYYLNSGFTEGWGYFFIAISSWLVSKGSVKYLYLSFISLAFAYAASDHSLLFGSVIYLFFAFKCWGWFKVLPLFTVITGVFSYLLLFGKVRESSILKVLGKAADDGVELKFESFSYLTTSLYSLVPVNGQGEVFTDPGFSRVGQTALWSSVFSLVLLIVYLLGKSGLINLLFSLLFVWSPFPLAIMAYDWGRWQGMIFLNSFLALGVLQQGLTSRKLITSRVLYFIAVLVLSFGSNNFSFFNSEIFRIVGVV